MNKRVPGRLCPFVRTRTAASAGLRSAKASALGRPDLGYLIRPKGLFHGS